MAKKQALGRGLGALIESNDNSSSGGEKVKAKKPVEVKGVDEINIELIEANPYQPRTIFDEEALNELADSIREIGIVQPLTVRKLDGDKFQLISGERRLKASKIVGLKKVPAYIRKADDQNMLEMALVENIQREDLDAIEIAISYQRLIEECQLTQESLSQRVGKKRATVTNYLRLLKLPAEIQLGIKSKMLSMGHARTLVTIDDPKDQIAIYHQIIENELSVRKVEELVRALNNPPEEKAKEPKQEPASNDYGDLKNDLSHFFQTKVELNRNNNGIGKIVIPFKSDEELERIIAIFDKLNA
ncbi:MAG: ParB/RepB/Spo0J family partition protein [Bacteroidales bacterium]|nr:ParB/RepB/Spo0J family partition protein [Bacteroidales bacterium]